METNSENMLGMPNDSAIKFLLLVIAGMFFIYVVLLLYISGLEKKLAQEVEGQHSKSAYACVLRNQPRAVQER